MSSFSRCGAVAAAPTALVAVSRVATQLCVCVCVCMGQHPRNMIKPQLILLCPFSPGCSCGFARLEARGRSQAKTLSVPQPSKERSSSGSQTRSPSPHARTHTRTHTRTHRHHDTNLLPFPQGDTVRCITFLTTCSHLLPSSRCKHSS